MARGRMINQSIATDKRVNSLTLEAQLVYVMTIPHLDRDGLILGEPYMLASIVCPRRPELAQSMEAIIQQWIELELVVGYEGKEDPILFFVGFAKNQSGLRYDRETPSRFAPPPGYRRTDTGLVASDNGSTGDAIRHDSGLTPDAIRHDSGMSPPEGNIKETNTTTTSTDSGAHPDKVRNSSGSGSSFSFPTQQNEVYDCWRKNLTTPLTPIIERDLNIALSEHGKEAVLDAIAVAVNADNHTMRYIKGVLRRRGSPVNGTHPQTTMQIVRTDSDDE